MSNENAAERRTMVPLFPLYREVRVLLAVLDGEAPESYYALNRELRELRGTPQEQVDWSEPDQWIPERLSDKAQEVAWSIWTSSDRQVNPRHIRGHWYLTRRYNLLEETKGRLSITADGRDFLDSPRGRVASTIDRAEGLIRLLQIVASKASGRFSDLYPEWSRYLLVASNYRAESTMKSALRLRLRNLLERRLLSRSGHVYEITDAGLVYLEEVTAGDSKWTASRNTIYRLIEEDRRQVREHLTENLLALDPTGFEYFVQRLLEEMGYEDVQVTSPTNDKGVDVVAEIQLGITAVREVVQVKRLRGNVHRPILDQLRGSLHRFNAVRGTIITTGGFSSGTKEAAFERGAAPITLIDGEHLLDLMLDYEIGVSKTEISLFDIDPSAFVFAEDNEDGVPLPEV